MSFCFLNFYKLHTKLNIKTINIITEQNISNLNEARVERKIDNTKDNMKDNMKLNCT